MTNEIDKQLDNKEKMLRKKMKKKVEEKKYKCVLEQVGLNAAGTAKTIIFLPLENSCKFNEPTPFSFDGIISGSFTILSPTLIVI